MATKHRLPPQAAPIGIRFPTDTRRWLEMHSSETYRSMNSIVIEAIRRYRAHTEQAQKGVQHG